MKRDPSLVGLSREHHLVLFHALELRRATPDTAPAVRDRFLAFWAAHGPRHFEREETAVLPVLGTGHPLAARVLDDHVRIAALVAGLAEADPAAPAALHEVGETLRRHVRLEEREVFPAVERELDRRAEAPGLPAPRPASVGK